MKELLETEIEIIAADLRSGLRGKYNLLCQKFGDHLFGCDGDSPLSSRVIIDVKQCPEGAKPISGNKDNLC